MAPDEPRFILQDRDGQSWPVGATPLTIGRGAKNTINLPDPGVSRSHATIWAAEGRCWLRDENSTSGTWVKGQRVMGEREVRPGDSIELPGHVFWVHAAAVERPQEEDHREAPVQAVAAPAPLAAVQGPPGPEPALKPAGVARAPRSRSLPVILGVGAAVIVVVGLVLWLVLGSGGGGSARSARDRSSERDRLPARTETSEPEAEESTSGQSQQGTTSVPRNTVVLYLVTSESSSSYLHEYDITLTSGRQTIIRMLPDSGELKQLQTNATASYAESSIRPYTVDGRYFVVRHTGLETNDWHEFTEYDPRTNARVLHFTVSDPINQSCVAILGDDYYYQSYSTFDPLYGHRDGELKRLHIEDQGRGEGDLLMKADNPQRCQGNLQASDGVLYDAWQDEGQIDFFSRDLTTGEVAEDLGAVSLSNPDQYDSRMKIAFEDGMVYVLTRRHADNQISIYRYEFRGEPVHVYQGSEPNVDQPSYFDADEGYVVAGDGDGYVLLVDLVAGTDRVLDVGFGFYDVEVLYTGSR